MRNKLATGLALATLIGSVGVTDHLVDAAPTAAPAAASTAFPYEHFWAVPALGREPVLGSGCGSDGRLGDTIPDGIWSGYVVVRDGTAAIDVVCVIAPESSASFVVEGEDNIVNAVPLVVDNSARVRYAPAPSTRYAMGQAQADGTCTPRPAVAGDYIPYGAIAWFGLSGGQITWVFYNCSGFARPTPELPPPTAPAPPPPPAAPAAPALDAAPALPAAFADPTVTAQTWWPYGTFADVPQLGGEPVRGSGCGGDGSLDDTIPDGLWAGYASYDPASDSFAVDVVCVYYGDVGEQLRSDPDAVVIDPTPGFVVINNSDRRRPAGHDVRIAVVGDAADGTCRAATATVAPSGRLAPEAVAALDPGRLAWIRIADGRVTGLFHACPA